jgi:hypothetical protein
VLIGGGGGTCRTSIKDCGGTYRNCQIDCQNTAELYDPISGSFAATGELDIGRSRHSATLLPDGHVLIAGGIGSYVIDSASFSDPETGVNLTMMIPALKTAELYDPVVARFSRTGDMGFSRAGQAASLSLMARCWWQVLHLSIIEALSFTISIRDISSYCSFS